MSPKSSRVVLLKRTDGLERTGRNGDNAAQQSQAPRDSAQKHHSDGLPTRPVATSPQPCPGFSQVSVRCVPVQLAGRLKPFVTHFQISGPLAV